MGRWLNQPEASILIDQIAALGSEAWAQSAQSLHDSLETPSELEIAQGHARKAKFYSECASLIASMAAKAESGADEFEFRTVEITPITLTKIPNE